MEPLLRPDPFPEQIGRYRILGMLGSGGMGEVFLAWDDQLKRHVAIKRLLQGAELSPEQWERFLREAPNAAKVVCHPNVVQIHDLLSEHEAIVMEYIEGRTLAERLAADRLETAQVLRLALEIARGLAAAHEAGLIHRDLKAANVLITRSGEHAKIVDFGLARPEVRLPEDPGLTRKGVVIGTCYAMSPEQVRGEELDKRSDLFSFGSLFHEMLTGHPPFRGKDAIDSLWKVLHEEPVHPQVARRDLPAEAADLLLRLLQKDREERPASAQEVIETLERLQIPSSGPHSVAMDSRAGDYPSDEETLLALPERREQNRALGSRRRLLIVGAAALLLALAIGSALIFRSMRPLRVAVVPLNYTSDDELDKAVTAIRWAALEALRNQRGIKTVASEESLGSTPIQIGKAVFADQVLTISIQREQGNSAQVSLERIKLSNGETLRSAAFDVPLGRQNRFTVLHDVVYTKVQKVFSTDFPKGRPPQIDVTVSEADYASFLGVLERAEAGHALPEDLLKDLQDLDTIMHTSPRFVEAPLLAARIELSRFQTWREPADLDKASKLAQKAQELAPDTDLRPLHLKVQIALARNQFDDAEKVVEDLERRDPGDPDILLLRADLAEKQDRPEEAKALLTEAVDQVHSWQNRYLLATFAARHGKIDEARGQLKTILRESPKNAWALEASGNFELIYGSSDEAEKIFNDLVILEPRRERASSNLAAVHALRGDFEKAEEIYQRVFKANSDHSAALINLAEVETALQKNDSAEMHYGRALELLTEREANPGLTPGESLLKAQCLVRLGRKLEAAGIVKSLREKTADDPLLLYQSALVLSLAGEQDAALEKAKAALRKGLAEHWFNVPGFDELRKRLKLSHWFPKKH